jgi:hypothetical protein
LRLSIQLFLFQIALGRLSEVACLVKDITRVKNRLKALYNSEAIKQRGRELYHLSKRQSWIEKLHSLVNDAARLRGRQHGEEERAEVNVRVEPEE